MFATAMALMLSSAAQPDCADHYDAMKQPEVNQCLRDPLTNEILREAMRCAGQIEAAQRLGAGVIPLFKEPNRSQLQGLYDSLEPYNLQITELRKVRRIAMNTTGSSYEFSMGQKSVEPAFALEPHGRAEAYLKHTKLTDRCISVLSLYVGNMTNFKKRKAA